MQTGVAPQSGFAETSSTFAATANSQPGMPYQQYQQPAQQLPQTQQPQPQQQQFSGFNQNQYPAQNKPQGTTGNYDLSDQDLQAFFSPKDITASLAEDLLKQFGSGSEGEESMDTSGGAQTLSSGPFSPTNLLGGDSVTVKEEKPDSCSRSAAANMAAAASASLRQAKPLSRWCVKLHCCPDAYLISHAYPERFLTFLFCLFQHVQNQQSKKPKWRRILGP